LGVGEAERFETGLQALDALGGIRDVVPGRGKEGVPARAVRGFGGEGFLG
jgi:hypothetical protein